MYVQLCRGPEYVGPGYSELVDRFERVAREVGLEHIYEGAPNVDEHIAAWREAAAR